MSQLLWQFCSFYQPPTGCSYTVSNQCCSSSIMKPHSNRVQGVRFPSSSDAKRVYNDLSVHPHKTTYTWCKDHLTMYIETICQGVCWLWHHRGCPPHPHTWRKDPLPMHIESVLGGCPPHPHTWCKDPLPMHIETICLGVCWLLHWGCPPHPHTTFTDANTLYQMHIRDYNSTQVCWLWQRLSTQPTHTTHTDTESLYQCT